MASSQSGKIPLVVFDFDGTLADSAAWFLGALNSIADRFGFRRVQDEELESLRGCSNREILRRLQIPLWKLPRIALHFRSLAAADSAAIQLFPGIRELLLELSTRAQLGVVTSNSEEPCAAFSALPRARLPPTSVAPGCSAKPAN